MIALLLACLLGPQAWAQDPAGAGSPPPAQPLAIPGPDTQASTLPGRMPWSKRVVGEAAMLVRYSMGLGVGETNDYTNRYSFLGVTAQFTYFAAPGVSIGVLSGWQTFYDREHTTEVVGNAALTATQLRYLDAVPILATGQYYLGDSERVHPYVGAGIGAYYTKRETWLPSWTVVNDGFHFGVMPEVGVLVTNGSTELVASVKFHYLVKSEDTPSETFMTFEIGALLR